MTTEDSHEKEVSQMYGWFLFIGLLLAAVVLVYTLVAPFVEVLPLIMQQINAAIF
jgi:hypothetical protein